MDYWGFPEPPQYSRLSTRRFNDIETVKIICDECKIPGGYHSVACSRYDAQDVAPEYLVPTLIGNTCAGVLAFERQFELFCATNAGKFAQYEAERSR